MPIRCTDTNNSIALTHRYVPEGDKINVAQMVISVFDKVENMVGKKKMLKKKANAGYKQFIFFSHQVFTAFFFKNKFHFYHSVYFQ